MPTPKKGARLGGSPAHQKLILSNLATALFEHGKITTTEAKARTLRPVAERLITKAKKAPLGSPESLHNRRLVLRTIRDKGVVHVLFTEIAERFAERPGGYTRITKIGPRKGDNAPMAVIELVTEDYTPQTRPAAPAATPAATPVATPAATPVGGAVTGTPAPSSAETPDASGEVEAPTASVDPAEGGDLESGADPAPAPDAEPAPEAEQAPDAEPAPEAEQGSTQA